MSSTAQTALHSNTSSASEVCSQATTPANVQIKPRNRSHDIAQALEGEWLDNNAFLTAVFNGMSITFPAGEKFFIDSVRHFGNDIADPTLKEHIRGFCGQEGFHRREHQRYNEALCATRGYDLEKLEGKMTKRLAWAQKNLSPLQNLAITVAIEHFTAVLAELLLGSNSVINKATVGFGMYGCLRSRKRRCAVGKRSFTTIGLINPDIIHQHGLRPYGAGIRRTAKRTSHCDVENCKKLLQEFIHSARLNVNGTHYIAIDFSNHLSRIPLNFVDMETITQ